jgi:8-oxo-dGTP diphosphatase
MIYDNDGNMLVQNRIKNDWPGITFPGGKVESTESIIASTIREVKEETNLVISDLKICGVKDWVNDGVRHIIFLFKTSSFKGELVSSAEGEVFWIKKSDLNNYKLANGFDKMFEVFENDDLSEFYYDINGDGSWIAKLL